MKFRNSRFFKVFTLFVLVNFLINIFYPGVSYALTAGPGSPEFSSFTPVSSTDMVNLFTGDFNYNLPLIEIPGPHGSGYAMSLSYNSGNSAEQESSWVGFGWSLNPGSINRRLRGFPDEFAGQSIEYFNKTRPNWTATAGTNVGLEAYSKDVGIGASTSFIHRFNNYTGYQKITEIGLDYKGMAGIKAQFDPNGVTFSPFVSPLAIINRPKETSEDSQNDAKHITVKTKNGKTIKIHKEHKEPQHPEKYTDAYNLSIEIGGIGLTTHSIYAVQESAKPFNYSEYKGFSLNWSSSLQINPAPVLIGIETGKFGNFNMRFNRYRARANTFGYMQTPNYGASNQMMDYYVEKDRPFTKRDLFIGMPFNNHDVFSVTGEGVMGGFRAFRNQLGHYAPNEIKSSMTIAQAGFEVMVGLGVGVGLDFGVGYQENKVDDWDVDNRGTFSGTQFRFNGDLGGEISYGNTELEKGRVKLVSAVPGFKSAKSRLEDLYTNNSTSKSSYINYSMDIDRSGNNLINGFDIVNKNGATYKYGQPVYVRNETNLSVDIDEHDEKKWKYISFKDIPLKVNRSGNYEVLDSDLRNSKYKTIIGNINTNKYANSFLLTEILAPNYIDFDNNNAISDGDFGGWTKFNYRSIYGQNNDEWYRYRMPYNGLLYKQNSISDVKDDIGTMVTGEKEVHYLKTIETKTHIAYFVTNKTVHPTIEFLNGSQTQRYDGVGAKALTDKGDPSSTEITSIDTPFGDTELEYLEKVVLLAKDRNNQVVNKPLKTVHFEYDYSLVPNVANNLNSNYNYNPDGNALRENSGKLTLKKVWTEYEGIVSAKISPYVFNYAYTHSSEIGVGQEYFGEYDHFTDDLQNPSYAPYSLGPWGNQMPNGEARRNNGVPWIDQSAYLNDQIFDPAAYQLKSIRLPSGGTIHIQYESDDYAYVQNRDAMVMARIIEALPTDDRNSKYDENPEFIVKVDDLGVNPVSSDEVDMLVEKINRHFSGNEDIGETSENKIYFKFLYALVGGNPNIDNCKSEYITGYANFGNAQRVALDNGFAIKITLGNEGTRGGERAIVPRQSCYEFVVNQRQGKLSSSDCIEPKIEGAFDEAICVAADKIEGNADSKGLLKYGIGVKIIGSVLAQGNLLANRNYKKLEVCKVIEPGQSFLKLPVLFQKYGGGVRVKRILLHDKGMETGDEVVYGTTYRYNLEDGKTSSGVATNEPAGAREENPLVGFLPKGEQTWSNRIISGEDLEQTEGPLGESILPVAQVGYSRVIVENIHTGKTGNGFTVNEFYTVKDYPYDGIYTNDELSKADVVGKAADNTTLEQKNDKLSIFAGLFNYGTEKSWMSQGYRFIRNNMHGQTKKVSLYGGDYLVDGLTGAESPDNSFLTSYQEYEYFKPGEKVKMVKLDGSGDLIHEYKVPGKEMDVSMEAKRVKDFTLDFNVEFDIGLGVSFPPPIFAGIWPSFSYSQNLLATHSLCKVIDYPAILKKVTNNVDGISSVTENIAFNKSTGDPVITRINDSYDEIDLSTGRHNGDIFNFSIPAEWIYAGMGSKVIDQSNTNQLSAMAANYTIYGVEPDAAWLDNPVSVINASIQTYANDWTNSWTDNKISQEYQLNTGSIAKLNNIWRSHSNYVFNKDETGSISDKVYSKGHFDIGQDKFDWKSATQSDKWIKSSEITKYSPNGEALEETNAIDIPSAVVYGKQYGNNVPVMIANNANFNSIIFHDFEDQNSLINKSHSGNGAAQLTSDLNILEGVYVNSLLKEQGAVLKLWMHFTDNNMGNMIVQGISDIPLKKVSQVGEWTLFEAHFSPEFFEALPDGESLSASITDISGNAITNSYIDDIKFQPAHSTASCFVYDVTDLRLLAQFDDQHFGLYYQYDQEGKLVRKIIETERGVQTLQETNYNLPVELRSRN